MRSKAIISALIAAISLAASFVSASEGQKVSPTPAAYNIAVILAEPGDKSLDPAHNKTYFEGITEQVRDYYCENSFGKWDAEARKCNNGLVDLNFDIYDNGGANYKLVQTQEYYGKDFPLQEISLGVDGNGRELTLNDTDRTEQFKWDAINKADKDINYNNYKVAIVIYFGDSQQREDSSQENRLWTQWTGVSLWHPLTDSQEEVTNSLISISENEKRQVWAHELGHALGKILINSALRDLYSKPEPQDYNGEVPSYFDVMGDPKLCSICLLTDVVSYFSSYSRIKLGWLGEKIVGYGNHSVESLETMKVGDNTLKYNLQNNAYYLLEARTGDSQYSKWDEYLLGDPLVIYRVSPKEIILNNEIKTTDIINIAKSVGVISYEPPIIDTNNTPFGDPQNQVSIGIYDRVAGPNSFQIKAQIYEYYPVNSVGVIMKPRLFLLGKMWKFTPTALKESDSNATDLVTSRSRDKKYNIYFSGHKIKETNEITRYVLARAFFIWLAVPVIIVLLLLRFCSKLIISRTKNKGIAKVLEKTRKIILWIIIFLIIVFGLSFPISFSVEGEIFMSNDLPVSYAAAYESHAADIDLHAYDDQGRHTGMNYETGKYENLIPDAEASGDMVYDDEWIFVPEGVKIRYAVSGYDIAEMMNNQPEFQELTDKTEKYDIQAVYYDPVSQRYESSIVSQQINPGEELEHAVNGTTDVGIQSGAVTIDTLRREILNARNLGLIDNQGIADSLLQKLDAAQKKLDQNETRAARNQLNALRNEIKAQQGKHIATDTANVLMGDLESLIDSLAVQPDTDISILLSRIQAAVARLKSLLPDLAGYLR